MLTFLFIVNQNQPALEKDRYKIRQAFVAVPGNSLIVADYGQVAEFLTILLFIKKIKLYGPHEFLLLIEMHGND